MVRSQFICRCGARVGCSPICADCTKRLTQYIHHCVPREMPHTSHEAIPETFGGEPDAEPTGAGMRDADG